AAPIAVEKVIDPDKREVVLKLIPDAALLDVASLAIEAVVNRAGKQPETHAVATKDGAWSIKLEDLATGSETTVNFNASAKTLDGKAVSPAIKPVKIDDGFFLKKVAEVVPPAPIQEESPVKTEPSTDKHEESPPTATNWLLVGGVVLGINLLMFGGGFFVYRAMKKANAEKQKQLLEKLS
ncbi:MAG: hypothetical protein LUQ11_12600, partial [Methylococcaceae bacterium]|nr:hypothetical protein [Methylococcaceae bacterium]